MYVSWMIMSGSVLWHSLRDERRNCVKESGGISFALASPAWIMEWTVREAGASLGRVERRGGSGLEESCRMYWFALEHAISMSVDCRAVLCCVAGDKRICL